MRHLRKLMAATAALGVAAVTTRSASGGGDVRARDAGAGQGSVSQSDAQSTSTTPSSGDAGACAVGEVCEDGRAAPTCPDDQEPAKRLVMGADGRQHGTYECMRYAVVDPLPPPPLSRGCGCHSSPGAGETASNE